MGNVKKYSVAVCVAILGMFCLSIFVRLGTSKILWDKFHAEKALRVVFFDNAVFVRGKLQNDESTNSDAKIDWAEKYPFRIDSTENGQATHLNISRLRDEYVGKVESAKNRISEYTERNLIGYAKAAEQSRKYESFLGKETVDEVLVVGDILKMSDGYWTSFSGKKYVTDNAESVMEFSAYCQAHGIQFAYICAPFKVCKNDDGVYGVRDFTNQNADDFLRQLAENGVPYIDLRENLHAQGLHHHELFFKTDHHWRPDAALWAAREVGLWLNGRLGYQIDTELLREDNFTKVKYEKYFLGSHGRNATLALAEPEDIELYYPKMASSMHITIPSKRVDQTGNFAVWYDMEQLEGIDYYNKNPYGAYGYGDKPLIKLHNDMATFKKKIMVVKDSFAYTFCPFFSLGVSDLVVVDLRTFTGSLRTLMEMEKPDVVLVLYHAGECGVALKDKYKYLFFFE